MSYRYGNQGLGLVVYIIITCLVIYVATLISPRLGDAMVFVPATLASHPWTLITSMFAHGGIFHIMSNMLVLYFFGTFLVALVGEKWFAAVYFVGGIAGNLLFWLLVPYGAALGTSGAIYAVGGALMVLRPRQPTMLLFIPIAIPLWVSILIGFALALSPGIAWQAHLGGLVVGILAGFYFRRRERPRPAF